jgi:hypothetical protein
MQCLIIRQPYASLIAFGKKRWEFRKYESKKEGIIGIAASANEPLKTWNSVLNRASHSFPRGVVLAKAELVTSFFITSKDLALCQKDVVEISIHNKKIDTLNEPIGEPKEDVDLAIKKKNWESFAWQLDNVTPLEKFVTFQSRSQSTWVDVEIPEEDF